MLILKIVGFLFLIAGFGTVFGARYLARKFNLDKNAKCDFEHEMTEEELEKYKFDKATVNVKMIGMLVSIPGLILILMEFR
ncbi:MAG: hypothetical protein FIA99_19315 [Ruminiclostridium sp.]|nr:hypothetical protein [Ruminiclostridium sp.]